MSDDKFWLEDLSILLKEPSIIPTSCMSRTQKLNSLSRLVIVISVGMYFMEYKDWLKFLLISLAIIIVIYISTRDKNDSNQPKNIENYQGVNTAQGLSTFIPNGPLSTSIPIQPVFSESIRNPPHRYDVVEMVEDPVEIVSGLGDGTSQVDPRSYPYGQYLSKTNHLPSDEFAMRTNPTGSLHHAVTYANNTYLVNDIKNREELLKIHKTKLNRRFRSCTNKIVSPYSSY